MSVKIYSNSCLTCGVNAVYVARVRKAYPDVQVINTRVEKEKLIEHITHQELAGLGRSPQAIVVEDGVTTLLKEWKP